MAIASVVVAVHGEELFQEMALVVGCWKNCTCSFRFNYRATEYALYVIIKWEGQGMNVGVCICV